MPDRSTGLYPGDNGEMFVSFERGTKGVPVESLIPEQHRGEAFGDFALADYFSLAELVLVSQEDFHEAGRQAKAEANQTGQPVGLKLPLDLDYLKLRSPDGHMNPERTAQIFEVVQAYWTAEEDSMAMEPGLVAAALHQGMTPAEVIAFIQEHTQADPDTGKARLVLPDVPIESEFLSHLLGPDRSAGDVTPETLALLARWFSSVHEGHATFELPRRKTDDLQFLGLLDASGKVNKTAAQTAGDFIWECLEQPDFPTLWRHLHRKQYPLAEPEEHDATYNLRIAELADAGTDAQAFVQAILQLAHKGVPVPTERLCRAARVVWELDRATKPERTTIEAALRRQVRWLDWGEEAAVRFGAVKSRLEAQGRPIGDFDTAIAAMALTLDAAVATANLRHFNRVEGLQVEDWTSER